VVSLSRKEGWIVIPKDEDEQWGALMPPTKRF
jgi:hypothetical protein